RADPWRPRDPVSPLDPPAAHFPNLAAAEKRRYCKSSERGAVTANLRAALWVESSQAGSAFAASPVQANAWHRQPAKSISLRGQERHGSFIHAVPRKAVKAGDSSQISRSEASFTFQ